MLCGLTAAALWLYHHWRSQSVDQWVIVPVLVIPMLPSMWNILEMKVLLTVSTHAFRFDRTTYIGYTTLASGCYIKFILYTSYMWYIWYQLSDKALFSNVNINLWSVLYTIAVIHLSIYSMHVVIKCIPPAGNIRKLYTPVSLWLHKHVNHSQLQVSVCNNIYHKTFKLK